MPGPSTAARLRGRGWCPSRLLQMAGAESGTIAARHLTGGSDGAEGGVNAVVEATVRSRVACLAVDDVAGPPAFDGVDAVEQPAAGPIRDPGSLRGRASLRSSGPGKRRRRGPSRPERTGRASSPRQFVQARRTARPAGDDAGGEAYAAPVATQGFDGAQRARSYGRAPAKSPWEWAPRQALGRLVGWSPPWAPSPAGRSRTLLDAPAVVVSFIA
jgi:hypothetical protein